MEKEQSGVVDLSGMSTPERIAVIKDRWELLQKRNSSEWEHLESAVGKAVQACRFILRDEIDEAKFHARDCLQKFNILYGDQR